MNHLNMTYDGNQLVRVDDTGFGSYDYSIKQYHDNNSSVDFAYDANGNMVYDRDRGIAAIRYNVLNLPDTIQFVNGNQIVHRYDATGNRLATDYYTRKVNVTVPLGDVFSATDSLSNYYVTHDAFHNHIVYEVDTNDMFGIEFVHNPEGYIRYNNMNEHYHFYYIKDHLGNVRETYKIPNAGTKECVQRMQYYPSGLPWAETTNSSEQPYKYNSKEFVEMHGLDEYDSEARWYYPAICRTTTMDPLAEKYYATSPYAWCGNNPVNCIDPLGLDTIRVTYEEEQWNISDPIIAEGDDVIIVTDEEGNEETITYDEGEYGNRVIALTLSYGKTKDDESFGVYHVSGASQNGTGFYVTRGGNNLSKGSGEGVPEGDYPILKPFDGADWQQAGLGGDIALRGIRFHPGTSYKSSEGCYILFTDYEISNGKTTFSMYNSRLAVKNFNILLGADPNKADYYYRSKKTGRDRYGAYFPNGIKNKRLIQKYRK